MNFNPITQFFKNYSSLIAIAFILAVVVGIGYSYKQSIVETTNLKIENKQNTQVITEQKKEIEFVQENKTVSDNSANEFSSFVEKINQNHSITAKKTQSKIATIRKKYEKMAKEDTAKKLSTSDYDFLTYNEISTTQLDGLWSTYCNHQSSNECKASS
jgi:uncharacterized protein HemX